PSRAPWSAHDEPIDLVTGWSSAGDAVLSALCEETRGWVGGARRSPASRVVGGSSRFPQAPSTGPPAATCGSPCGNLPVPPAPSTGPPAATCGSRLGDPPGSPKPPPLVRLRRLAVRAGGTLPVPPDPFHWSASRTGAFGAGPKVRRPGGAFVHPSR